MTLEVVIINPRLDKALKVAKPITKKIFRTTLAITVSNLISPGISEAGIFWNTLSTYPYNVGIGIAAAAVASAIIIPFIRGIGKGNYAQIIDTAFYLSAVVGLVSLIIYVANKVFKGLMSL